MCAGEKHGVHYSFISAALFHFLLGSGYLADWQQLHGHFYGTLKVAANDGERARERVCVRVSE